MDPADPGSPVMPSEWTFWADQADARDPPNGYGTGAVNRPGYRLETEPIGPVQVTGFTCSWALNGWGNAEVVIPINQEGSITRRDLLRFYGWRLFASYGGVPVWAGLPTGLEDTGGAAVTMAFVELPGYLDRKQHAMRYNTPGGGTEQTRIGADLAARYENIAVPIVQDPGPGFLRVRSYDYLEGQSRAELLQNLCAVIQGPQFRSEYDVNPATGRPRCTVRIAYPRVGRQGSGLGLTVPGQGVDFSAKWDGEIKRTRTFACGDLPDTAAANARRPIVMVVAEQLGIPNVDTVEDYPGVVLRNTLQERANAQAAIYGDPSLEITATMPLTDPLITSYGVGDDVVVNITDELMPEGLVVVGQLAELAADAIEGTATWTVTIPQPPPRVGQEFVSTRLSQIDSQLGRIWRAAGRIEPLPAGIEE
jgi:hypothetical protein